MWLSGVLQRRDIVDDDRLADLSVNGIPDVAVTTDLPLKADAPRATSLRMCLRISVYLSGWEGTPKHGTKQCVMWRAPPETGAVRGSLHARVVGWVVWREKRDNHARGEHRSETVEQQRPTS